MGWIKDPLLPIALFGVASALILSCGCGEHGSCIDYACTGGKFSDCSGSKFDCTEVEGCPKYS